jgi:hypothetical protein
MLNLEKFNSLGRHYENNVSMEKLSEFGTKVVEKPY